MNRSRKSTIKEVAERAGVSTTTVSIYLSGKGGVCSAATGARILAAVEELRYTPNSLSRSLRTNATRTIGICTEDTDSVRPDDRLTVTERLLRGIARVSDESGYALLHYPRALRNSEAGDAFVDGRVDGLLMIGIRNDPRSSQIAGAGLPVVMVGRPADSESKCGAVYPNEGDMARLALTHLWELGHRRIAFLTGSRENPQADWARCDAAIAWLSEKDICDPHLIVPPIPLSENVDITLSFWSHLPAPPTAVFCANERVGGEAMEAARKLGLRVPEDLSIICIDETGCLTGDGLSLTSVDMPAEAMGAFAVQALLRLIGGAPLDACRGSVPVAQIVARLSTAAPRQR